MCSDIAVILRAAPMALQASRAAEQVVAVIARSATMEANRPKIVNLTLPKHRSGRPVRQSRSR